LECPRPEVCERTDTGVPPVLPAGKGDCNDMLLVIRSFALLAIAAAGPAAAQGMGSPPLQNLPWTADCGAKPDTPNRKAGTPDPVPGLATEPPPAGSQKTKARKD
jgi:hypothetical protein